MNLHTPPLPRRDDVLLPFAALCPGCRCSRRFEMFIHGCGCGCDCGDWPSMVSVDGTPVSVSLSLMHSGYHGERAAQFKQLLVALQEVFGVVQERGGKRCVGSPMHCSECSTSAQLDAWCVNVNPSCREDGVAV